MKINGYFKKIGAHWKLAVLIFIFGATTATGTTLLLGARSVAKLKSDLLSARTSLADATQTSAKLAGELQAVSVQLGAANSIIASQKSTINGLHTNIGAADAIVDNINNLIAVSGSDFSKQLEAFATGFEELYQLYH